MKTKIIQIIARNWIGGVGTQKQQIVGLGEDGRVYFLEKGEWFLLDD